MKLLHVVPTYYPATYWGGPIFSVYGLNNALSLNKQIELQVLTTDSLGPKLSDSLKKKDIPESLFPAYKVHFAHRNFAVSFSLELLKKLPCYIRNADIVHLTATYSFTTIPTIFFCRLFNKPLVWSPRGAILETVEWSNSRKRYPKRIWNFLCNLLIRRDKVILHVTSQEEKYASLSHIPKAEAEIIVNGVDTPSTLAEREYLLDGKTRLLFMGRLHPVKGIENLLNAFFLLNDTSVSLVIYGTGDSQYVESLQNLAKKLGLLNQTVFFAGHVDGIAKQQAFLNADICIVPSHTENFGIVVAEALAFGVPVIASHHTPWEEIEKHQCGLWVDNSPTSLMLAIQKLQSMDLAAMGEMGWLWMKQEFEWSQIAKKMSNIYIDLLNK